MTRITKAFVLMAGAIFLVGGLSACGRQGPLETAPPIFDKDGKAVKRDTEKAEPSAKQANQSPDPYTQNTSVRNAPLEGTGNAQKH